MGDLLRRYWIPACLSSELPEPDNAPIRVRLLSEDLVAFRDTSGKVGLVAEHCPHRGASVYFGRNEDCGLRCVYHGWKFDVDGNCVDMPNEPAESNFKNKVTIAAYPTHESGGVIWTYMGPRETLTPFRDFGTETLPKEHISASKSYRYCNWIQSMEGNLDTAHISWLHQYNAIDDIPDDDSDKPGYPSNAMSLKFWRHDRSPRLDVVDQWYGMRYAGIRTTPNGHCHVRINAFVVPNITLVASIPFGTGLAIYAPIDDDHCWRYALSAQPPSNPRLLGGERRSSPATNWPYVNLPRQLSGISVRKYVAENDYMIDRYTQKTSTFTGVPEFVSQDLMVTESMGPIYDRTQEHLGTTDTGIIRMRTILLDAAKGLAEGKRPPAVGAENNYRGVRSAEKILASDEDWRVLGTDADPAVREWQLAPWATAG
jgi:nitrite reductase/ring-hydroxylating ferredoxin subunit